MNFKTFYIEKSHKCHVNMYISEGVGYYDLVSYGKRVAWYNFTEKYMHVEGWFSATTAKHINIFLQFHGFEKMTKKQLQQSPQAIKKDEV